MPTQLIWNMLLKDIFGRFAIDNVVCEYDTIIYSELYNIISLIKSVLSLTIHRLQWYIYWYYWYSRSDFVVSKKGVSDKSSWLSFKLRQFCSLSNSQMIQASECGNQYWVPERIFVTQANRRALYWINTLQYITFWDSICISSRRHPLVPFSV